MKNYIENKIFNNHLLYRETDPYNPYNLPPFTIRVKYTDNYTPEPDFKNCSATRVSQSPNVWDITYFDRYNWGGLCSNIHNSSAYKTTFIEVIGANANGVKNMNSMFMHCENLSSVSLFDTSTVTKMHWMFNFCYSLSSVPLFDTSNVTTMWNMFNSCTALTAVPLFNTSNVTDFDSMFRSCKSLTSIPLFDTSKATTIGSTFRGCRNVQCGALALYQQASTQANPPTSHSATFRDCGTNTPTGSAELAQIPDDWK